MNAKRLKSSHFSPKLFTSLSELHNLADPLEVVADGVRDGGVCAAQCADEVGVDRTDDGEVLRMG